MVGNKEQERAELHRTIWGIANDLRGNLVDNNFVDTIIQLPDNLFFGTSIATCIMVIKKGKKRNDVLFIDASKECVKVTNNNKLTEDNIAAILKLFTSRKNAAHSAALVHHEDIAANDYNLSVSTYVEQEDTREMVDIKKLNAELAEIVERETKLRKEIDAIIKEIGE